MMDDGEYGIEKQVPGRRTKAALWITQGMDLYMAAQLLSHSDLKMLTKIYDHTDMETLQGALLSIQRSSGKKEAPAFAGAFILSCLNSIDASWNRRPQSGAVLLRRTSVLQRVNIQSRRSPLSPRIVKFSGIYKKITTPNGVVISMVDANGLEPLTPCTSSDRAARKVL